MNTFTRFTRYAEYQLKILRTWFSDDRKFHSARLKKVAGYNPDFINPLTLNEKICHRLIYDRDPFYTLLADKLAVRDYIYSHATGLKIPRLLGVYKHGNDIDFSRLPNQFVLKCNHDCGSTLLCLDKHQFDIPAALRRLNLAMKRNMYYRTREWQYKNIPPVILCEEYIDLFSGNNRETTPEMLRIHCFHGSPYFIEADFTDTQGQGFINVYDREWNLQPLQMEYPNTVHDIPRPALLQQALSSAQSLSKQLDYCRVDLMLQGTDIYFSEITLSPRRGKLTLSPPEWDRTLGEMWTVPPDKNRLA
ncbi:ATP-grasp fold amidoligase family protein [Atlantibacter hermannii]|uniref:ATP-grasp fold amidoligase family protein n=1 Tax=Atlantibacter hermannii TaxID=565 RepID=UPI00289EA93F|nr:ATP-grasp fold amidoligase family protein [Atlantibacter hermannii]